MRLFVINDTRCIGEHLTIIDDVGISDDAQAVIREAFTHQVSFLSLRSVPAMLWGVTTKMVTPNPLVVFPGNGGWLMQRMLENTDNYPHSRPRGGWDHPFLQSDIPLPPQKVLGADISRINTGEVAIPQEPWTRIMAMEDVVETGGTAQRLREQVTEMRCGMSLATAVWHDHHGKTWDVLNALSRYSHVLIWKRVRTTEPKPYQDIRSLSTLARKHHLPQNHVYSRGREELFVATMRGCLKRHPWLLELGNTLGYRKDTESITSLEEL